ncbi:MAG: hypothetical protein ACK4E8_12985, partial [Lacibacter sp.]
PASSNHIFCIARNTGQLHQKKHDLTMRAKIKTDTVYATVPKGRNRAKTCLRKPNSVQIHGYQCTLFFNTRHGFKSCREVISFRIFQYR